jgi:hypothetical protein
LFCFRSPRKSKVMQGAWRYVRCTHFTLFNTFITLIDGFVYFEIYGEFEFRKYKSVIIVYSSSNVFAIRKTKGELYSWYFNVSIVYVIDDYRI